MLPGVTTLHFSSLLLGTTKRRVLGFYRRLKRDALLDLVASDGWCRLQPLARLMLVGQSRCGPGGQVFIAR
jgi:hypothetical protein